MTTPALIDIGIAERARPGELKSGDRCVVKTFNGRATVGVIDGLGHGEEAARAAAVAAEVIETFGHESVDALMVRCHERLRATRGAAITLLAFDGSARELSWIGAGSVTAFLVRRERSGEASHTQLMVRAGVAGVSLPSNAASTTGIARGDIVVIATDGVRSGFTNGIKCGEPVQKLAERLLEQYQSAQDDALLVVVRVQE